MKIASSQREVRVIEGSSYRKSTVSSYFCRNHISFVKLSYLETPHLGPLKTKQTPRAFNYQVINRKRAGDDGKRFFVGTRVRRVFFFFLPSLPESLGTRLWVSKLSKWKAFEIVGKLRGQSAAPLPIRTVATLSSQERVNGHCTVCFPYCRGQRKGDFNL